MLEKYAKGSDYIALLDGTINTMLRGGASHEHILEVLYILNKHFNGSYTEETIQEDILIAHSIILEQGGYKQKRNIQQEVENLLVFRGNGITPLADMYADLKLADKEDKAACRVAINRLVAAGKIEKIDTGRTGTYRRVNTAVEKTQFLQGDGEGRKFPISLPFDLGDMCTIFPKSIIIVAGSKSAGKTATLLNIALMNQNKLPVDYLNSDMGDEEFTSRMRALGCVCPEDIRFNVYSRSHDFQDLVTGEKKIFIVDFLEIHDEFYKIGHQIKQIWDKLREGVAIIAIQMKQGSTLGRGGEFTKEKARLYLSMDYVENLRCTRVRIEEAKSPATIYPDGIRGWWRHIKIIGKGSKFQFLSGWSGHEIETGKTSFPRTF